MLPDLEAVLGCAEALQDAQNYIRTITLGELRQSVLGWDVLTELLNTSISCQESDRPLAHPFFWGAWVCQGDTSALPKLP